MFRKSGIFSYLAVFLAVLAFDTWLKTVAVRSDGPTRLAAVRFVALRFDPSAFAPLRLAGAWKVQVDDPRFGGVSALALDGQGLLALTDSGTVVRLPKPGAGRTALVRDLPAGPGIPQFKINRDSEALARDAEGRGWWIAFEQSHQLWLYGPDFRRPLTRIDLGEERWRRNRGVEAMAVVGDRLLLFPESGEHQLELSDGRLSSRRLINPFGSPADGAQLPDGRLILVTRKIGLAGIAKRLVTVEEERGVVRLQPVAPLGLGATDNVEAIAVETRAGGATRLWLMTDNDFRPRAPTLLVALDLP